MEMHNLEKLFVNSSVWSWVIKRWMVPRVVKFAGPLQGKILELGCGQGVTSEEILKLLPSIHLTSLDYDPKQVALAKVRLEKYGKQCALIQGDATRLFFKKSAFDVVIELNAFHHIEGFQNAMKEANRVLKPGGIFLCKDIGLYSLAGSKIGWNFGEGFFSKKSFIDDLENAGFKILKTRGIWWFTIMAKKPAGKMAKQKN